ncbi:MAG: SGNH/GDSL hydrolase family protein [Planctomycetia bacterium]|nr:SGNH/GDSL hydrolase family protein [Planctomycetia bacterium]
MPESSTKNSAVPARRRAGVRHYVPRLLLALVVFLVTLKLADVLVGWAGGTQTRHRLRLAPNAELRHKSREFDYVFRTNKLGLRGPDVPFVKPAGTFRIVVLGDSFVAGYGVADEHVLTRLIEQELAGPRAEPGARFEVVNVGRVGTSTIRELDLYESLGRKFQPDLVILAYYLGNDLAEVVQEQTDDELAGWTPPGRVRQAAYVCFPNLYLELAMVRQSRKQLREFTRRGESEILDDVRQEAVARGRDPAAAADRYQSLSSELRADVASGVLSEQRIIDSCIEPDRLVRALDPDDHEFAVSWPRTKSHLDRLQAAVVRDGAKLAVVAIPAPFQLDPESLEFHRKLGYEARDSWLSEAPRTAVTLAAWARDRDVPYLNLTAQFRELKGPLYFVEDVHFNPEGNARAAEAIVRFVRDRKLCP